MHPMFPALAELELARRQAELRGDRLGPPRRVRTAAGRAGRLLTRHGRRRPSLRLVRG